ncbi:MAG TPA: hypothetical protein VN878_03830 [Usitatibacter sp.]|nr:hypothetical protein [Usitatibacter sp.]
MRGRTVTQWLALIAAFGCALSAFAASQLKSAPESIGRVNLRRGSVA